MPQFKGVAEHMESMDKKSNKFRTTYAEVKNDKE